MKTKRQQVYTFDPGFMDRGIAEVGTELHVFQPYGCPKNGTMGMTYVQKLTGEFVGLVCKSSLVKTGRTAPVRDLAAEARDARSERRRPRPRSRWSSDPSRRARSGPDPPARQGQQRHLSLRRPRADSDR